MDDLIRRQEMILAMEDTDWYHINKDGQLVHGANSKEGEPLYKAEDVYKVLNDMPSAQPDFDMVEKIDKAYDDGYKCGYLQAKFDYETDTKGEQDE